MTMQARYQLVLHVSINFDQKLAKYDQMYEIEHRLLQLEGHLPDSS